MVNGRKPQARHKQPPPRYPGRHGGYQYSDWRVDPQYGRTVYQDLGPLSQRELTMLARQKTHIARRYLRTIYGGQGGEHAWRQYLKWQLSKEKRPHGV